MSRNSKVKKSHVGWSTEEHSSAGDDRYSKHDTTSKSNQRRHSTGYIQEDRSKDDEVLRNYKSEKYWAPNDPANDYEVYERNQKTYAYVHPSSSGRRKSSLGAEQQPKRSHERRSEEYEHSRRKASNQETNTYPSDEAILNYAATKIQSAFRGHQARKRYWKKLEHLRRQEKLEHANSGRQDEYIIASATSIVDDASVIALSPNADPNLGLTAPLPNLDSNQRINVMRKLDTKVSFENLSSVHELQTETSPTIIVLGGINPTKSKDYALGASMFMYNVQNDKWFYAGTMPEPRNYHRATYINGKIYIVGGYNPLYVSGNNQMMATKSIFQMSVRSKRWREKAEMHEARACHGICLINDNIMVIGGRDSSGNLLSSVELYYPKRDKWVIMKSMPEAIMGLSCAVLDGCAFVIGGIVNDGHPSQYTVSSRVYIFDFEKNLWSRITSLPEPRAFSSATTLKREIWLWCGVSDATSEEGFLISTNSVLVYNPDLSRWDLQTDVGTPKHATALAKIGRRIYLFGGMSSTLDSRNVLDETDYYNSETDKFREGLSLPCPVTGAFAISLPILNVSTSDPRWNSENIDEEVKKEAATKIQAVFRGYKTRSSISIPSVRRSQESMKRNSRMDAIVMQAIVEPFADKWKEFQRVQIEDWPPVSPDIASSSEINIKIGTLPRGYTVTSSNSRTKVRRYALLPPHIDPNMSIIPHLCNVQKRNKSILGLRKVDRLPTFTINMLTASVVQDDSLPVILLLGGLQPRDPTDFSYGKLILRYHTLKNRFEYFGALPEPRNFHAAVYYQENVYVTGGCNPDKRNSGEMVSTNTVYCLNIHSNEWEIKAEMHCCRSHHSLVAALGKIFAVGGRDNNGRLVASIEAYDPEEDKWSILRPMTHPRMGMACTLVDDHIWVLGGIGLSDDSGKLTYPVLSSVISYDIGHDSWISRPPLRCPRAYASCVVIGDSLWLVGGASKDRDNKMLISMGAVDKYYTVDAQWGRKTILNYPRHSAAVVAVDTCLYAFGGASSQEWSGLAKNEMIVIDDISLHVCQDLPAPMTGVAAVAIPPVLPSLRSESLAILLHTQLTYH